MAEDIAGGTEQSTTKSAGGDVSNGINGYHHSDKHKSHHHHKDKHSDKKHHHSSKSKDRDKERSSHSTSSSSHHHKSSSKDKEKDRRHKPSSSSSKEHHKSSSSSNKDKDRTKEREKSDKSSSSTKHHSTSSSHRSKDKHSSSSSKQRHSSSSHKDKSRDKEVKEEPVVLKENEHRSIQVTPKVEVNSSIEFDQNVSTASSCDYNLSQFKDEPNDIKPDEEDEDIGKEEIDDQDYLNDVKKESDDSDEDMPLASHTKNTSLKRKIESDDDEDDVPLLARKKSKTDVHKTKKKKRQHYDDSEEDFDDESDEKFNTKVKKQKKVKQKEVKLDDSISPKKTGRKKKEEEEQVWKWWEEEKKDDGTKWKFLEHKGPVFAAPYESLPDSVKFFYDGREMKLSTNAEEVAGFYAKMLDHDYTTKDIFNTNFFKDWRKVMTEKERSKINDLKKCNFKMMHAHFMEVSERNRNRTKEEKAALKEANEKLMKEYGFCTIDGHREKIGNFKIEPPGLFRGRGEHPKMGTLKRRVEAEDIIINCSKDSNIPQAPPGHKWKEVRHDPTVTWLASWTENVQNQIKYIMLNPSSKLKGEKDWQKYETARRLHKCIDKIRREYREDLKSKEMRIRQRAVALYFIDKLALRAGNEKDEDQADTVGCCSLRVEHITLHEKLDDKEYVVVFDFLGKDSIRYYNEVPVEKRVFKNLQLFMENKKPSDDLFDRLNTNIMNKHLNELMEGLTAKVFRTYNASWTLQQQLEQLTNEGDSVVELMLSYNRANRAVAILCNHQRSVPKTHEKSMGKLKEQIDTKKEAIKDAERQVKDAARDAKHGSVKEKTVYDKKKKLLQRLQEQLTKLEIQETDRDENKSIALGTSKLNYLDPRISVAWCKKFNVPIEKIYSKTQRDKFRWAIDMAGPDYHF